MGSFSVNYRWSNPTPFVEFLMPPKSPTRSARLSGALSAASTKASSGSKKLLAASTRLSSPTNSTTAKAAAAKATSKSPATASKQSASPVHRAPKTQDQMATILMLVSKGGGLAVAWSLWLTAPPYIGPDDSAKSTYTAGVLLLSILAAAALSGFSGRGPIRVSAALGLMAGFGAKELLIAQASELSSLSILYLAGCVAAVLLMLGIRVLLSRCTCMSSERLGRVMAQMKAFFNHGLALMLAYLLEKLLQTTLDGFLQQQQLDSTYKMGVHLGVALLMTVAATAMLTGLTLLKVKLSQRNLLWDEVLPLCEVTLGFLLGWLWNLMVIESVVSADSSLLPLCLYTAAITVSIPALLCHLNHRQSLAKLERAKTLRSLQLQLASNSCAMMLGWAWFNCTLKAFTYELAADGSIDDTV